MGGEEWTKLIKTCNVRFWSSLDIWSVSKIFHFACVSYPRTLWVRDRGFLPPSWDLTFILSSWPCALPAEPLLEKAATSSTSKSESFPAGRERAPLQETLQAVCLTWWEMSPCDGKDPEPHGGGIQGLGQVNPGLGSLLQWSFPWHQSACEPGGSRALSLPREPKEGVRFHTTLCFTDSNFPSKTH